MATQTLNGIGELSKAEVTHIQTLRQVNQRHKKLLQSLAVSFKESEILRAKLVESGLSDEEATSKLLDMTSEKLASLL